MREQSISHQRENGRSKGRRSQNIRGCMKTSYFRGEKTERSINHKYTKQYTLKVATPPLERGRDICCLCASISRILSWAAMYLGVSLPTTSSGTSRVERETRPCTQVGILPFHRI